MLRGLLGVLNLNNAGHNEPMAAPGMARAALFLNDAVDAGRRPAGIRPKGLEVTNDGNGKRARRLDHELGRAGRTSRLDAHIWGTGLLMAR